MNILDEDTALEADPVWRRYVHLLDCRHFNRLAGMDMIGRQWERANGPEISRLEAAHPDFVSRYWMRALLAAQKAATPGVAPRMRRGVPPGEDLKSRQYKDE